MRKFPHLLTQVAFDSPMCQERARYLKSKTTVGALMIDWCPAQIWCSSVHSPLAHWSPLKTGQKDLFSDQ